jgi:hypothetical protein
LLYGRDHLSRVDRVADDYTGRGRLAELLEGLLAESGRYRASVYPPTKANAEKFIKYGRTIVVAHTMIWPNWTKSVAANLSEPHA